MTQTRTRTHEQVRSALQRVQKRVAIESRPGPKHNDPWTWSLAETAETAGTAGEGD